MSIVSIEFGASVLPVRFWQKISIDKDSGCWLWLGYIDRDGYARFSIRTPDNKSRAALAHRYAYLTTIQKDYFSGLPGFDIHHGKCRTRSCVNPSHVHPIEKLRHSYYHGKMRNYVEVCSGTVFCLCWQCCELYSIQSSDTLGADLSLSADLQRDDIPF